MTREELNSKLKDTISNVYYNPPATLHMSYPCIVYSREGIDNIQSNNKTYIRVKVYKIILITTRPADVEVDNLLDSFLYTRFVSQYTVDDLYHNVIEIRTPETKQK